MRTLRNNVHSHENVPKSCKNEKKYIYVYIQPKVHIAQEIFNPFMPTVAFSQLSSNICCPRDCVSRHNGGTAGAPLKPLRVDSALRAL